MTTLEHLLSVSQASYDSQRQTFAKILAEESHLRSELARLKKLEQSAAATDQSLTPLRAVGADILWQSWLTRSRTNLNIQLARTLAIKAHEQSKVRQAFGKVVALQQLILETQHQDRKLRAQRLLSTAIDQSLSQSGQGNQ